MKTILLIYSGDDWKKERPFTSNANYRYIANNYEQWSLYSKKEHIQTVRASIKWYNEKTGKFSKYWHYDGAWKKIKKAIKPDIVFDKTMTNYRIDTSPILRGMMKKGIKVFNNPAFRDRFGNKLSDLRYWSDYMPETLVVFNAKTARSVAQDHFGKQRFVAKEIFGTGGKNVYIGVLEDMPFEDVEFPLVLQKFMTSVGAPGLKGTISDLRLEFMDHKLVLAYSRVAQDSLYTNTNKGAYVEKTRKKDIPKEVMQMVKEMQKKMRGFSNCHYALDFFFTKDGPKFIESATCPGFGIHAGAWTKKEREKYFAAFNKALLSGL
jgi:glutathione synthase/RimK-type ligase-like ATP-grasp enzyme